ncbi:MAG: indolepyruvate ferredoxin oxidoreductase subunit alpha [Eubacterium sp.]
MSKQLVMGNEAIALGAIKAGVNVVAGYPGTPSTEVLETIAKNNSGDIYVEWSVNEKAALEVAAGASYTGARVMVTMKQVGLNVASDPLMCVNYVGIKGGMVIVVADDPGPISSQTEQDTRHFAQYAKMMVFDPSSPKEAYEMIGDAFEYSEKYSVPVIFRPTTRVCHGYQTIDISTHRYKTNIEGFIKDSKKWVIFPRLSYNNHKELEAKMSELSDDFSSYRFNTLTGTGKKGIITGGVSYEYVKEVIKDRTDIKLLKIATANAFPEKLALEFLDGLDEVLAIEELDPVLERCVTYLCGKYHLHTKVFGKLTNSITNAGENSVAIVNRSLSEFLGEELLTENEPEQTPQLPIRPPVLCAGCPHRASFYAVKKAMIGKKTRFCGDIGCYTLGNAMPLDMTDTCLCMGADITMAQGFTRTEPDVYSFAFIGDSTFFASGMTGVVNAVYNQANITIILLDNSTTAMTGHQPHPGTGITMMGEIVNKINPELVLKGIGVDKVVTANPLELDKAVEIVRETAELNGVKVIIFKSPCIAVSQPDDAVIIDSEKCINCKKCIKDLGCPAIVLQKGRAFIENSLCFGCSICEYVCPVNAIHKMGGKDNE